jgi:uncharacterized membrane-anchored protein
MNWLPGNHPERYALADEVHARPPEPLDTPCRVSYVALLLEPEARAQEAAQLQALCERFGAAIPAAGATQFSLRLGDIRLKWERHGEFSAYTVIAPGLGAKPFADPAATLLPDGWLKTLPGQTMMAAHAHVQRSGADNGDDPANSHFQAQLKDAFNGGSLVGSEIAEGAGLAFTDFKLHADGCSRFFVVDRGLTRHQAGRSVQRLFEIEAYRMLALLALPIARRQGPRIVAIEKSLAKLTNGIAQDDGADAGLLQQLTRLAAEVESDLSASQYRFGACRAYADLVRTRIADLRERRIPGTQTLAEFMTRRFEPAVATCATVSSRLHGLSERVAQASGLLSTRVDIAHEQQNQSLLTSMDRRAKQQLQLQKTVEGLSLAAIVYYGAGVVSYVAKALKSSGVNLNVDIAVGIMVPVIALLAYLAVRRTRRAMARDDDHAPNA